MTTESESSPRQQKASVYFKTGNDAALKSNFDYAIQMYRDATVLVPEHLQYRQALRGIERRKFNNDPKKVGWSVGARVQPIRIKLKAAKAKKDWVHVIQLCEDLFVHNPWDVGASTDLAEAAEQLELLPLARWSMESVQKQVGKDADFWRYMAHVYEINEDWQKAIESWERVKEYAPNDENARRKMNALSASATIKRSGLHEALNRQAAGSSGPEKAHAELDELKKDSGLSADERWEKQIAEDPKRVGNYLGYADDLKAQNRLDDAQKVLTRGREAIPGDQVLESAYAEVQIARINRAIEAFSKRVKTHPNDAEAKARLAQLREKLDAYEIADYRRRIETQPGDMHLRLQFGKKLIGSGQIDAAIAEFQQSKSNAATRVQSLYELGLAFEAKNLPKLAERSFEEALKSLDGDDQAVFNDLHYHLGRLAESQGNMKSAEEHYNEVAANDFSYKDVATRLGNLNNS
jgi:tetratricopeptide (TPR) repeat protein